VPTTIQRSASSGPQGQTPPITSPGSLSGTWYDQSLANAPDLTMDATHSMDAIYEFEHLQAIEDLFAYTAGPSVPEATLATSYEPPQSLLARTIAQPISACAGNNWVELSVSVVGVQPADHEYLRGQGCFRIPSSDILQQIMLMYFRFVHPALPIIAEDQFWRLWGPNGFNPGPFSLLVLRAMLFVTTSVSITEDS
jgi:hypothetical protein